MKRLCLFVPADATTYAVVTDGVAKLTLQVRPAHELAPTATLEQDAPWLRRTGGG